MSLTLVESNVLRSLEVSGLGDLQRSSGTPRPLHLPSLFGSVCDGVSVTTELSYCH